MSQLKTNPINKLLENLTNLSDKDKRALSALLLFLLAMVLYGLFAFHQYANKIEKSALNTQSMFFWMRNQAGHIQANTDNQSLDIAEVVNNAANMQNIQLTITNNNNQAQFNANHDNAVVIGSFLAKLDEQGVVFDDLSVAQKADDSIEAQATVHF